MKGQHRAGQYKSILIYVPVFVESIYHVPDRILHRGREESLMELSYPMIVETGPGWEGFPEEVVTEPRSKE